MKWYLYAHIYIRKWKLKSMKEAYFIQCITVLFRTQLHSQKYGLTLLGFARHIPICICVFCFQLSCNPIAVNGSTPIIMAIQRNDNSKLSLIYMQVILVMMYVVSSDRPHPCYWSSSDHHVSQTSREYTMWESKVKQ